LFIPLGAIGFSGPIRLVPTYILSVESFISIASKLRD